MKLTKIMAIFVVLMLTVITVCVTTPDSNGGELSETSGTAYYCPDSNMMYRSAEPIPEETIRELKYYPLVITEVENVEKMDNEVREYLLGMRDVPESVATEPGQSYYCYYIEMPYQIDVVEIRPDAVNTTLLPFNPGKYSITIESITVRGVEYRDSYKVRLCTQYSNGYSSYLSEITVGNKCDFDIKQFSTCWFEPSDSYNYAVVKYKVSSTASVKEFTHGDSGISNTLSAWCSGTVKMYAGEYAQIRFSTTNAVFMIEKGSENEQRFLNDIVSKNIRYSYYGGYYSDKNIYKVITSESFGNQPLVISTDAEYSVYMLRMDQRNDCWVTGYSTTDSIIMDERVVVNECNNVTSSKIRFYAEANKTFEIGLKYDASKYIAILVPNDISSFTPILESGKVYSVDNKTGCSYTIEFKYIGTDSTDDVFHCSYEIQKGNLPNSDGLSVVFAIITIILCALAFGILVYAGRKPKW